jgi:16S rRNA (uracil1498-N3)-methyltransferase
MNDKLLKAPRLFTPADLNDGSPAVLSEPQAHYLKNVMRATVGDSVRLFNGRDGEWHGVIDTLDKKKAVLSLQNQIREQPESRRAVHLLFAPIKKARMEWLIEKSVELGVTDLHPVITHHTEVRDINHERTLAQIIEAAEQCERLDIPRLHELRPLKNVLGDWPKDISIMIGLERADAPILGDILPAQGPLAFLIGPEGGFSAEEKSWPDSLPILKPVSLGPDILRAETAACYVLVAASMMKR